MKKLVIIMLLAVCGLKASAQFDPTLAGMIVIYTDKAKKELKSQEAAMLLETTGHIWIKEEMDATIKWQTKFNDYLDSFRSIVTYASQVYGFYHEISQLTHNLGAFTDQFKKTPNNALAVALSARRNAIYRDILLGSVDICNDIRQVCLSDIKMTEAERLKIVFNIRPKLKLINQKVRRLTMAVKYTTLGDVWREIDNRYRSYDVNKGKISDEAFRRWRSNGKVGLGGGGGGNPGGGGGRWPWVGPWVIDSIHPYPWHPDTVIPINPHNPIVIDSLRIRELNIPVGRDSLLIRSDRQTQK